MSTITLPRKSPVRPPTRKVTMKARANSIGTVRWMSPCQRVRVQLYTLSAVGTAMTRVVTAKKKPK
ncbi:hypothetical protein D3C81_1460590 [compost metagenome]